MFKKYLSLILVLIVLLSLVSCNKEIPNNTTITLETDINITTAETPPITTSEPVITTTTTTGENMSIPEDIINEEIEFDVEAYKQELEKEIVEYYESIKYLIPPEDVYNPASDFIYEIIDDEVYITKYVGESEIVNIPPTIEGKNVVEINIIPQHQADYYNSYGTNPQYCCDYFRTPVFGSHIKSVIIPNTVSLIGHFTFYRCEILEYIQIPDSVVTIGSCAFQSCISLKAITLPNSIENLSSAFVNCQNLISVNIPTSISVLTDSTFELCESLVYLEIPNNIVSIREYAFYSCKSLKSVKIPDSIEDISSEAFTGCDNLDVKTRSRISEIPSRDHVEIW